MGFLMDNEKDPLKAGRQAEKRTAKRLNADLHPGSGTRRKGDMTLGKLKIENKATTKYSYRIEYGVLRKIAHESLHAGQEPVLAVQFVDDEGRPRKDGKWILIQEEAFDLIRGWIEDE